jgi:DNA invertase Pin-like site-specific DNA recombinase
MKNVVIYSRVSTNIQDNKRQVEELTNYCNSLNYNLRNIFQETISGAKKNEERFELMEMLRYVKENNIDKVLCWELSRLGRNTIEVLKTIELFNENKISLYIKNYNIETLTDDKQINPLSQFMIQILSSVSSMERTQIRQRVKSGYEVFRSNGGRVGRKEGFKKSIDKVLEENKDVAKLLKQGYSVRNIIKLSGKSSGTIQKVSKLIKEKINE